MAEFNGIPEQQHPNLILSPEERRLFAQVFSAADKDGIGVVTGDVALSFFPEKTKLPSEVLGEIWQIADTEDKGFLTPSGFYIILRLIGYAQAGRAVSAELALQGGGPLPRFEGINVPQPVPAAPLQSQSSGGSIRVPPLLPEKAVQYASLFEESGAQNGLLPGSTAKQIFDRAQLPNDVLVRIWNLADTEQRGLLSTTEFIIAMHLLASYRSGAMRALPQNLPAGLYEAAARRGAPPRQAPGPRSTSDMPSAAAIPRQFSGSIAPPRTSSPLTRQALNAGSLAAQTTGTLRPQSPGDWAIPTQEKVQYDGQFAKLDAGKKGFVSGEEAVGFFGNSRLSEDDLATIWDLADINSEGQLNRDEFAVAMHLIRQKLRTKAPLPTALPANLIPPSMRRQPVAPRPSTAPGFNPPNAAAPKSNSAVNDLFGLDALSAAPPQVAQSTGGSSGFSPSSPRFMKASFHAQGSPTATVFKPFVPSSSFGQTMTTPQGAGSTSNVPQNHTAHIDNDDLLGDTDPGISSKLTQETIELANLSNQVGTLTNQMQDVKSKRVSTEQNLSEINTQKRDFETRLAQLRSAYEQEAREVRALEESLAAARNESSKLEQDIAMVQHSQQNLQEQHRQISAALEADQRENANLKERMREVNNDITQLKPLIEKVRSEARQQKGLVAINKKQLATIELEREKAKGELGTATREHQDAVKELEQTQLGLGGGTRQHEEAGRGLEESSRQFGETWRDHDEASKQLETQRSTTTSPAPTVASPALSTTSTNPFFKRSGTMSSERGAQAPSAPPDVTSPNHIAFDDFFGPSFTAPATFNHPTEQASISSSIRPTSQDAHDSFNVNRSLAMHEPTSPAPTPLRPEPVGMPGDQEGSQVPGQSSAPLKLPGAFPGDSTPLQTPQLSGEGSFYNLPGVTQSTRTSHEDDPFAVDKRGPGSAMDAFDSASERLGGKNKEPKGTASNASDNIFGAPAQSSSRAEFPPIEEFGGEESESESEKGFDDDFTTASPEQRTIVTSSGLPDTDVDHPPVVKKPPFERGPSSSTPLPTPNAQQSPPTYNQTINSNGQLDGQRDANKFPPEYQGLLPAREDPTSSPPDAASSESFIHPPSNGEAPTFFGGASAKDRAMLGDGLPQAQMPMAPGAPTTAPFAYTNSKPEVQLSQTRPPIPSRNTFDDFDNEFGDLSEAQAADEKVDDDFNTSHQDTVDEFNPTFDSPAPSKATASSIFRGSDNGNNTFADFESSVHGTSPAAPFGQASQSTSSNVDWDAMFAGMGAGSSQANGHGVLTTHEDLVNDAFGGPATTIPPKPPLGRALTAGTEHDDPILKRLTAMGYPRDKSLSALEKFDYNIDKAADYLTLQS